MSKQFNLLYQNSNSWKLQTVQPNILISPELAGELLALNSKNRPVKDAKVKEYTEAMKSGKWLFNGDSIRITNEGVIVDGQKKLLAVIKSGTTQTFNIQTGLDPECFNVIDIGQPRSASDVVAVMGHKNHHIIAGACKLIIAHLNGGIYKMIQGYKGSKTSQADIYDFITKIEKTPDMDLLQECAINGARCAYKFKGFSGSNYTAFMYLFAKKDRDSSFVFFHLLSSGENISSTYCSMIYLLRNKLILNQTGNTRLQTLDKYALLIKSWNAFRKRKEGKQLSWQPKEEFPTIQ